MSRPKATIILLTYRQQATVARAMESLLHQNCTHSFEILVADDASPDATRAICEEYARRYPDIVRIMPPMPNRGLVGNYFDAFEAADGHYIADCAGDDEWLDPRRLQLSIDALDADPSLSAVFTDVEILSGSNSTLASQTPERRKWMHPNYPSASPHSESTSPANLDMRNAVRNEGSQILFDTLNNTNALPFILSSALYRKSAVLPAYDAHRDVIRCPEAGVEDLPIIAALGAAGDILYLPIVGYRYYIEESSISNNPDPEKQYKLYSRLLTLVGRLAAYYGIPLKQLSRHFHSKTRYLAGMISRIPDRQKAKILKRDLKTRAAQWPQRLSLSARLHLVR